MWGRGRAQRGRSAGGGCVAAVRASTLHCVGLCLAHGACASVTSVLDGKALAHWVAALGSTELLATILAPPHAVHVDTVCYDGHTPLAYSQVPGKV